MLPKAPYLYPQFLNLVVYCFAVYAEQTGGFGFVAVGLLQSGDDALALRVLVVQLQDEDTERICPIASVSSAVVICEPRVSSTARFTTLFSSRRLPGHECEASISAAPESKPSTLRFSSSLA